MRVESLIFVQPGFKEMKVEWFKKNRDVLYKPQGREIEDWVHHFKCEFS